jgi:hypothetical protein
MFGKNIIKLLVVMLFTLSAARAAEVVDVRIDNWAAREIIFSLTRGYLTINEKGQFRPDDPILRTDFVNGLVKSLGSENMLVQEPNKLVDLTPNTKNVKNILISQELDLIFGYPDKTFKPEHPMTRAEASSALGHISRGPYSNTSILNKFKDANKIPSWALNTYAKAVKNDLYINHPDKNLLRPDNYLTRAEAAVLFNKVQNSLELIEDKYKTSDLRVRIPDVLISTETLHIQDKPISNKVEIYDRKKVIKAGNIIKGVFDTPIAYQKAKVGDIVEFSAPEDVSTEEGTFLYPKGTKFSAEVLRIKKSTWRDKTNNTLLVLDRIMLTDGYQFAMAAVPLTDKNKDVVYVTPKNQHKDWLKYQKETKPVKEGEFLVNYASKMSPRIKYKEKQSTVIYLLLTDDLIFRNRESF